MDILGVHFVNSDYAVWGLAIVVLCALMVHTAAWRGKLLKKLGFREGEAYSAPKFRKLKNALNLLGVAFLWLALMGPQWGQKEALVTETGLDLCIALDISRSMLAEDLRPSRLESVKNQLPLFFNQLSGDRVAITAFAGSAFIASPLTSDYSALNSIIDPLATDFISDQSTNLASGIGTCMSALKLDKVLSPEEIQGEASKVILLVTDGGSTADEESAPVEKAHKLGVPIFVMAVGTAAGAPIPVRDDYGVQYLKDPRTNEAYISKLDEKPLKAIAEKTSGKIFYASAGNQAWLSFRKTLDQFQRDSKAAGAKRNLEDRFQVPLAVAFVLLLLDLVISETRLWAILLLFLIPQMGHARSLSQGVDETHTYWDTRQGLKKFGEQKFDEAMKDFGSALETSNKDWTPRYNWATGKIFISIPKDAGELKSRPKETPRTLLEAERELLGLLKDVPETEKPLLKIIKYQLGWIKWLKNERQQALRYFYESLADTVEMKEIDDATRQNITVLLVQMSQSGSGGGSGNSKGGEGEDEQKSKVSQGQGEKPKFTGTDVDENQANKILQSVGTKEQETQKKKTRGEAKDRDAGQKGNNKGRASGKDPQW